MSTDANLTIKQVALLHQKRILARTKLIASRSSAEAIKEYRASREELVVALRALRTRSHG